MLYTIGYQGKTIDEFMGLLWENEVNILVDVRHSRNSKLPDYGKAIEKHCVDYNIKYIHLQELGNTPTLRRMFKPEKANSYPFYLSYKLHVEKSKDLQVLKDIVENTYSMPCLMCMESNPDHCHRSALVKVLNAQYVQHLSIATQ